MVVEAEESFGLEGSMMIQKPLSGYFIGTNSELNLISILQFMKRRKSQTARCLLDGWLSGFLLFWLVNISRSKIRELVYFEHSRFECYD